MKAMTPSAELAAVVGDKAMPRTEITKKIWDYIKKNKLQDAVEQAHDQRGRQAQAGVRRQEAGLDVRDDRDGREASQVAYPPGPAVNQGRAAS